MSELTQAELQKVLEYNPETGVFIWRASNSYRVKTGDTAGSSNGSGYLLIQIAGIRYVAHRLAWLYMKGRWPDDEIDHINHVRNDNRWDNLREVTRRQNGQNVSLSKSNTSGVVGVCWDKRFKKWKAAIGINRKSKFLGYFNDKEAAITARKNAEAEYGFHPSHGTEL